MSHKLIDLQNRNEQDIIDDRQKRWSETLCNKQLKNMQRAADRLDNVNLPSAKILNLW